MAKAGVTLQQKRSGMAAPAMLACAVGLLALPSAVLAFSSRYEDRPSAQPSQSALQTIVPGKIDPRLARSIAVRALAKGQMFRFTPAATPLRPERVVTVAVQFDPSRGRGILVRAPSGGENPAPVASSMGVSPMAYNLGVAPDYKSFAGTGGTPAPNPEQPYPGRIPRHSRHRTLRLKPARAGSAGRQGVGNGRPEGPIQPNGPGVVADWYGSCMAPRPVSSRSTILICRRWAR